MEETVPVTCADEPCDQCGAAVDDCCRHCKHYRDMRAEET